MSLQDKEDFSSPLLPHSNRFQVSALSSSGRCFPGAAMKLTVACRRGILHSDIIQTLLNTPRLARMTSDYLCETGPVPVDFVSKLLANTSHGSRGLASWLVQTENVQDGRASMC